jgi:hypothetical protein
MGGLSGNTLLRAWEAGASQPALERALTLLALAHPEKGREALARLTIGQRNALLVAVREQTFGAAMSAYVECASCGTRLELTLSTRELGLLATPDDTRPEVVVTDGSGEDEWRLSSRVPTTEDLRSALAAGGTDEPREILLDRCVLETSRGGRQARWKAAPPALLARLIERMAEVDSQATVQLRLGCPGCGVEDERELDIAAFLWTEVASEARRLMREVASLARAFAWRETDILAMSARRRHAYLELVGA